MDNLAADYLCRSATTYDGRVKDEIENPPQNVHTIHLPAIDDIYMVNDVGCKVLSPKGQTFNNIKPGISPLHSPVDS